MKIVSELLENPYFIRRQSKYIDLIYRFLRILSLTLFAWILGYFNFSYAIVFVTVGIYVVHIYYRKKKTQRRVAGRIVSEDERAAIMTTMKDLPSWVFFPDIEKAEWLNKVIAQLWPFISSYVKDFITYELQPIVEEKLPSYAKPFRFSKLDLGDMAPRVGGLKTYSGDTTPRDEVSVDVEFYLFSDAGIRVEVRGIQSGIKDLEIRGTLRILLRPLIQKLPLVGAVTVCFINNPYINFDLTNLGNVLEFPGVGELFRGILEDLIAAIMVLPNRFSYSLVKEIELSQLRHPMPQGIVRIHLMSASKLIAMDVRLFAKNTSDPYCIVKVGAQQFKTSVVKNSLNPTWDEYFEAIVDQRQGQCVELLVYDKDTMNKGDFLGRATISIEDVYSSGLIDTWVQLAGVKSGSVHLRLTWLDLSLEPQEFQTMAALNQTLCINKQFPLSCGFLYVVVDSARNLRARSSPEPDPCGRIMMGNVTKRLKLMPDTPNPVWEKVAHFPVQDVEVDVFKVEIYHQSVGEKSALIGDCSVPIRMLLSEPDMLLERPFPLNNVVGSQGPVIYLRLALRSLVVGKKQVRKRTNSGLPVGESERKSTPVVPPRASSLSESTDATNGGPSGMTFRSRSDTEREVEREKMATVATEENKLSRTNSSLANQSQGGSFSRNSSSNTLTSVPASPMKSKENANDSFLNTSLLEVDEQSPSSQRSGSLASSDEPLVTQLNMDGEGQTDHGRLELTIEYSDQKKSLCVTVGRARNLIALDTDGVSDPYVKLHLEPKRFMLAPKALKTAVMHNTLNPEYNETFTLPLEKRYLPQAILVVTMRNHVSLLRRGKKSMGCIRLQLSRGLAKRNLMNQWFPIAAAQSALDRQSAHSAVDNTSSGYNSLRRRAANLSFRLKTLTKHPKAALSVDAGDMEEDEPK